ncbi:M15 family metallopeptidase [Cellulosimicrobium sp. SL-1]|uniref:M15 family metallopeptidase n=1 Tax=Cellulosimicrobium sp. SL-1 TaxID=2699423 RepID=UPI0013D7208D|nr:M15 family metallopeptidase [Cellulosimicrobium sp. SL-1]
MTATSTAPPTGPADHPPGGRERRHARVPRRHRAAWIAAVVALVLVLGGGGGAFAWYRDTEYDALADRAATAEDLLAASDGKVADPAVRTALTTEVDDARALLAAPFLDRMTTGTDATDRSLVSASDAVHASMLDHARSEVTAARASLATASALGEKIYAATEGLGADEAVRGRLRDALDTAAAADAAADAGLAGDDLARLEQAVLDLGAGLGVVSTSTEETSVAQDAVSCPAPDQVWDPDGGRVPDAALAPIPWSPGDRVRADVLDGLVALDAAYVERFGVHLTINSSYRTFEEQQGLYDPSSPIAAPPGCSNHGLGFAVDLGGGVQAFGTPQYEWLKQHAETYGWTHPDFAEPDGRVPEPWHWESVLARADG